MTRGREQAFGMANIVSSTKRSGTLGAFYKVNIKKIILLRGEVVVKMNGGGPWEVKEQLISQCKFFKWLLSGKFAKKKKKNCLK